MIKCLAIQREFMSSSHLCQCLIEHLFSLFPFIKNAFCHVLVKLYKVCEKLSGHWISLEVILSLTDSVLQVHALYVIKQQAFEVSITLSQKFLALLCIKFELIQGCLENFQSSIWIILQQKSHSKHVVCFDCESIKSLAELIE